MWGRGQDGNYSGPDGSRLVREGKRWSLQVDGRTIDLGKKATFDHAERALAQHHSEKISGLKQEIAGVQERLVVVQHPSLAHAGKAASHPGVMQLGKRGGAYYIGPGGRKVYAGKH
jgi:hypothetical protein